MCLPLIKPEQLQEATHFRRTKAEKKELRLLTRPRAFHELQQRLPLPTSVDDKVPRYIDTSLTL
jgi:hypothetical protein